MITPIIPNPTNCGLVMPMGLVGPTNQSGPIGNSGPSSRNIDIRISDANHTYLISNLDYCENLVIRFFKFNKYYRLEVEIMDCYTSNGIFQYIRCKSSDESNPIINLYNREDVGVPTSYTLDEDKFDILITGEKRNSIIDDII